MHTVREFVEKSFGVVGISIRWEGQGEQEIGINVANEVVVVRVDPKYFRPAEVELLLGNPAKAEKLLGWKRKIDFESLVKEMVDADLAASRSLIEDHN